MSSEKLYSPLKVGAIMNTVAANRQIPAQQVFPGAQGLLEGLTKTGGDTAKYALENKLVDALASSAGNRKSTDQRVRLE